MRQRAPKEQLCLGTTLLAALSLSPCTPSESAASCGVCNRNRLTPYCSSPSLGHSRHCRPVHTAQLCTLPISRQQLHSWSGLSPAAQCLGSLLAAPALPSVRTKVNSVHT